MLFKNPSLLAKNILRDQACCVRLGGKTPRYPTTLEISLSSMDHNRPHMRRKCWKQKDIDSSSMRRNLPKFNNLPTCSITEQKIRPIFRKYLICSYLIFPLFSPRLLSQVSAQFKSNIHIMKILLVRRRNIHFANCVMTAVLTTCAHYRKKAWSIWLFSKTTASWGINIFST